MSALTQTSLEENEINVKVEPVTTSLRQVVDSLEKQLTHEILVELVSKLYAIRSDFTGDGAGLSGGTLSDKFVTAYLSDKIPSFVEYHVGESDIMILGLPLSMKKIHGKSTIALDWSKNKEHSKKRERFDTDMMIINLKTKQWWKKSPIHVNQEEIDSNFYSTSIKAGIYFISHTYCKSNICLSSNNKTDSLIESNSLYKMLKQSIVDNMVIEFPTEVPKFKFNILNAFEKVQTIV